MDFEQPLLKKNCMAFFVYIGIRENYTRVVPHVTSQKTQHHHGPKKEVAWNRSTLLRPNQAIAPTKPYQPMPS